MKRISFTMTADNDGKITVTNTLKYIIQNIPEIKVPDVDIATIPLATLTLAKDNTKKCVDGLLEGVTWNDEKCAYTDYKCTLIFK